MGDTHRTAYEEDGIVKVVRYPVTDSIGDETGCNTVAVFAKLRLNTLTNI